MVPLRTSPREEEEIHRANESRARVVVFIHGLWLLASSWDRWRSRFDEAGYATVAPGWPGDPETVEEAHRDPARFANKRIDDAADHAAGIIRRLAAPAAIVGHSFGGLLAQRLAGLGLSAATVAIDPAPFRGVLPLPLSALRAAFPVLANPANWGRAVALTFEQFRFAFANAVPEDEARQLYDTWAVAAPGAPLFQAATANLNPWTQARVDTSYPDRGPLLIVSGEKDHTVPRALAHAAYVRQRRNPGITEFVEVPDRGHSLTIDQGWREVAELALRFVQEHHPARAGERPAASAGSRARAPDQPELDASV